MKWIAISGSRQTNKQVELDVRREVNEILKAGDGIVAGGAMGVDYIASDEVLRQGLAKDRLKICLPTTLGLYSAHYRKRATEGVVTIEEAELLINQLEEVKKVNVNSLIENTANTEVNTATYFQRHNTIIGLSNELLAFQVNNSAGTQDTVEKARAKDLPVRLLTYTI